MQSNNIKIQDVCLGGRKKDKNPSNPEKQLTCHNKYSKSMTWFKVLFWPLTDHFLLSSLTVASSLGKLMPRYLKIYFVFSLSMF